MRMKLPVAECLVNDRSFGASAPLAHLVRTSASETAAIRLCGAMDGNRPAVAGQVALGERRVCNTSRRNLPPRRRQVISALRPHARFPGQSH